MPGRLDHAKVKRQIRQWKTDHAEYAALPPCPTREEYEHDRDRQEAVRDRVARRKVSA